MKSWPVWVVAGLALLLACWGVAPPAPRLLAFPIVAIMGGPLLLAIALLLVLAILGAFVLPIVSLAMTQAKRSRRIGLACGGMICSFAVIASARTLGVKEDVTRREPKPPADCKPVTTDTSAINRSCQLRFDETGAAPAAGDCPASYDCMRAVYEEKYSCQLLCYADCGCVKGLHCVNGTCQRGKDLPP